MSFRPSFRSPHFSKLQKIDANVQSANNGIMQGAVKLAMLPSMQYQHSSTGNWGMLLNQKKTEDRMKNNIVTAVY